VITWQQLPPHHLQRCKLPLLRAALLVASL
jgi:hypothetical protein